MRFRARQSQRAQMHHQTSSLVAKNWRRTPYHEDIPEGEEHLPIQVATTPTISIRGGGTDPPTTRNSVDIVSASATRTMREVAFEDERPYHFHSNSNIRITSSALLPMEDPSQLATPAKIELFRRRHTYYYAEMIANLVSCQIINC